MRRFISIVLTSVYLCSATELHEIAKIADLTGHYQKHKNQNHLDFWAFLTLHYFSNHTPDADYEEDMKLPFKHGDPIFLFLLVDLPRGQEFFSTKLKVLRSEREDHFRYLEHQTSAKILTFWHPPELFMV